MAILLVTYDLGTPEQTCQAVFNYLKRFAYCKVMESVWLLDTNRDAAEIRDGLKAIIDPIDIVFVTRLARRSWASYKFGGGDWLNKPGRNW